MRTAYLGLLVERRVRRWSPVDREARRGQAECAAMSGRIIPAVPTRSGPRSPTFFIHLYYRLANSWRGGGRRQVSPSGIVDAFEGPHRAIGPYERSAQPRAHLHRTLPLHHSPDGRAPWAPSAVQAAIARNSPKKAFPEETSKMADGQLARAVVPGEPRNVAGGARRGRRRPPEGAAAVGAVRRKSPGRERG